MSDKHKRNITQNLTNKELSDTLNTVENMLKVTSKNPLKKTADTKKRGFVLSKVNHQQ